MRIRLLICISVIVSFIGRAEIPDSNLLWDSFITVINKDILSNANRQREISRLSKSDCIDKEIYEIKSIFNEKYSSDSINKIYSQVEKLIANPDINDNQLASLKQQYRALCRFESVSRSVYDALMLSSKDNEFKRIGELMQIEDLAPIHIQWMAKDLKNAFEKSGLYGIAIEEEYIYLKDRVKYVKESLESVETSPNGKPNDMMTKLRSVLDVVNEISPDFPQAIILFDQKF